MYVEVSLLGRQFPLRRMFIPQNHHTLRLLVLTFVFH